MIEEFAMRFIFQDYTDYEEGKLARVETMVSEIPVNIHAEDDSDWTLQNGQICEADVCAVGNDITVYSSEEEYAQSGKRMAVVSMIPMGTFPANPEDKNFKQSAHILYVGKVVDVRKNETTGEDEPNYLLTIQTYEMQFELYVYYEGSIERGNLIYGVAWLFADVLRAE